LTQYVIETIDEWNQINQPNQPPVAVAPPGPVMVAVEPIVPWFVVYDADGDSS
jgi:hypothetical protein